jgi:uncharacterized protein (TIGR03437 family)
VAPGRATIIVMRGTVQAAVGSIQVAATGPAIFTANSAGYGVAAAQIIRVKQDGSQTYEPVAPIDFGAPSDRLFLALYGTAVRGTDVWLRIGSLDVPVLYAGPQSQYPGLDQISSAELPRSLAGAGQVNVVLQCDGVAANTVAIVFR